MRSVIFIGWIFCIFSVKKKNKKNKIVPVDTAFFSWPEAKEIRKSPKINLCKNSAMVTKCSMMVDHKWMECSGKKVSVGVTTFRAKSQVSILKK